MIGDGVVGSTRAGVDWFADNADFLGATIGAGTDALADGVAFGGDEKVRGIERGPHVAEGPSGAG